MPTYIILMNYTDKGIQDIRQGPQRLEAAKQSIQNAGGQLHAWYLTMGQFDVIAVVDMPSDEVHARCMLNLASYGNLRTTSMRAFAEAEAVAIIRSISGK
jgi:uncharacterized protein with GYD domain